MNDQNLQNVPFTPGRPLVVPTSSFTKDVQESIVDNYFNNSGSVYANTVDSYNQSLSNQQAQPVQRETQQQAPQLSADEIASLSNIKRMIESNPSILDEVARRELGQGTYQQQNVPQNYPPQPSQKTETDVNAGLWESLFKSDQETQQAQDVQPKAQEQVQQQQQQSQPNDFARTMYTECMKSGVDYNEVAKFAAEFMQSPNNFVDLFKAYKDIENQQRSQEQEAAQQQQPPVQHAPNVNLSEAPMVQSINVLSQPNYNNNTNPYFR